MVKVILDSKEYLLDVRSIESRTEVCIAFRNLIEKAEDEAYPNWRDLRDEINRKWGYLR